MHEENIPNHIGIPDREKMDEIVQQLLAIDNSNINRNTSNRPPLSSTGFGARILTKTKILELKLVSVSLF